MNYQSTRNNKTTIKSSEAIVKGLALDGGLFVPDSFPKISNDEFKLLGTKSYTETAEFVLKKYLTDFTDEEVNNCVTKAYTAEKFGGEDIAPLHKLSDNEYVLELWHGPTCAFKDMALQILPHLLTTSMKKTGVKEDVVILVATSGDTGKAALEGFRDVDGTKIIVFYPQNGVSHIQKLQMVTQEGNNVGVCAVEGNFDDAQNGVKAIFTDSDYAKLLSENNIILSSANSINWGRLVPQIVYYVRSYAKLLAEGAINGEDKINIVVPTGNFGNILAAYYAMKMGVKVNKLICASNSNNVLTDFINTGIYDRNRDFKLTVSPSMDILISSNLERFLYDVTDNDTNKINSWMKDLKENGKYEIDEETRNKIQSLMYAGCCDEESTMNCIGDTKKDYSYVVDTHTSVAVKVYNDYKEKTGDKHVTVIASTASPYKFGKSVLKALSETISEDEFVNLETLYQASELPIPKSLGELKTKPVRFTECCNPSDMKKTVSDILKIK